MILPRPAAPAPAVVPGPIEITPAALALAAGPALMGGVLVWYGHRYGRGVLDQRWATRFFVLLMGLTSVGFAAAAMAWPVSIAWIAYAVYYAVVARKVPARPTAAAAAAVRDAAPDAVRELQRTGRVATAQNLEAAVGELRLNAAMRRIDDTVREGTA